MRESHTLKGRVHLPQALTIGLGSKPSGKEPGSRVSLTPVIIFQPGLGLREVGTGGPADLPAQWILVLPVWPPTMSFEGVVAVATGIECSRSSEGHSVEAISLLFPPLLFLLFLLFLQLLSGFNHRQAAVNVVLGHQVSTCDGHLWGVSVHGGHTQASLSQEDREG